MATGPDDIRPRLDAIVDALIWRDMYCHGYLPASGGWYDSSATAVTDPDNPVMPGWVPGPGGAPTGRVLTGQGFGHIAGEADFDPTNEVYEHWKTWVPDTFEPYLDCPLEKDYGTLLSWARQGTETLSRQNVLDEQEGTFTYGSNDDLGTQLTNGTDDLGDLEGEAIDAFRTNYWGKLDGILDRLSLVARMNWVLAEGEALAWKNYWNDLSALVGGLPESIRFPNSGQIPMDTISTITSLGSKLPVVGPLFGAVGGVVSTLNGIEDLMASYGHGPREAPYDMPDSAAGCAGEISRLLGVLSDDLRNQEEGLTDHARNVEDAMGAPEFSLERPGEVLDADERTDVVAPGQPGTVAFLRSEIDDARERLHAVADVLDEAQGYNRVSIARFAFTRPAEVGRAQLGPYNAMDNVCETLNSRCNSMAIVLRQVSEVLRVVHEEMESTDAQIRQRLGALGN